MPLTFSSASQILEAIEGATILSGDINEDEGMHIYLADGRCLVFVSDSFALMLQRLSTEKLH